MTGVWLVEYQIAGHHYFTTLFHSQTVRPRQNFVRRLSANSRPIGLVTVAS